MKFKSHLLCENDDLILSAEILEKEKEAICDSIDYVQFIKFVQCVFRKTQKPKTKK